MRRFLFILLTSIPLVSFGQTEVTHLARLPVFCDVAGQYKGSYSDGSWSATIDPYTGIANVSIQSLTSTAFSSGVAQRTKDAVAFTLNLPDGSAWRGKFVIPNEGAPTLSGHVINFDGHGKFSATRETASQATCRDVLKKKD